jgi:hypothetical protein
LAFAIQRVLPTSPIYRGPNPTHIEVQICAHKGSKALPTSQRTLAFALDQISGTQQLDTLAIRTSSLSNWTLWLSAQDFLAKASKSSNWTLQLSAQEFPSNWTLQLSAQEPPTSHPGYMRNRTMACVFISTPSKRAGFQPVRKWIGSEKVSMILPQVHLRKPCYDFSFL